MASTFDPFTMVSTITGQAILTPENAIKNAVTRNSYFLNRWMEGKPKEWYLQGGTKIVDIIYLQEQSNAQWYNPDKQDFNYVNVQSGQSHETNWRHLFNHWSFTDHERIINEGGGMGVSIGAFQRFKQYMLLKLMNGITTWVHQLEEAAITTPDNTSMEAGTHPTANVPNSIGVHITENTSGLPTGFTTVQTLSPATFPNWDNQRGTYAVSTGATTADDLWDGFRKVFSKCSHDKLPMQGEPYASVRTSPSFIGCSLWGMRLIERFMRTGSMTSGDARFLGMRSDPAWPYPVFNSSPMVYISGFDGSAGSKVGRLFTDGAGGSYTDENDLFAVGGSFKKGPRFWFFHGMSQGYVWMRDRVMYRKPPFSPDRQPFNNVIVTDTWCNITCQNRRELGILGPSASLTSPAQ